LSIANSAASNRQLAFGNWQFVSSEGNGMTYIDNSDIEQRLGSSALIQLADDDGNGVADVGVIDEARLGAEGEVNSYLARRYVVPIDLGLHGELADILASAALDLAEYRLRLRRPPVSEDARRRREQAIDWLSKVADGRIELPSLAPITASTTRGTVATVTGEERLLTREELDAF
jgi:phage gp36-like protein